MSRLASSFIEAGTALPLLRELLHDSKVDPAEWAEAILDRIAGQTPPPAGSL